MEEKRQAYVIINNRLEGNAPLTNKAPRSKLRGITEHSFEDFSETELNPVANYGEYSSLTIAHGASTTTHHRSEDLANSTCREFRWLREPRASRPMRREVKHPIRENVDGGVLPQTGC